jgi:hypothetical protein
MYNLFVSSSADAWEGNPWDIELGRAVREYTDNDLSERFGDLNAAAIAELRKLPSIFAYEAFNNLPPKFGSIRDITKRQGTVRVEYEIQPIEPFLTAEDLDSLMFELDISKWEMNRTHWAVKDVNLAKELHGRGITLPDWTRLVGKSVDVTKHTFDVGLSFPGEVRPYVEDVAQNLERLLGPNSYFYDNNYMAQLARPNLDTLLQEIYRDRSKLIVVFIGGAYQQKDWCGIEWRAIRQIIADRKHDRIMFVRMDDGQVDGVMGTDGFVDGRTHSAGDVAAMIAQRVGLLA